MISVARKRLDLGRSSTASGSRSGPFGLRPGSKRVPLAAPGICQQSGVQPQGASARRRAALQPVADSHVTCRSALNRAAPASQRVPDLTQVSATNGLMLNEAPSPRYGHPEIECVWKSNALRQEGLEHG